MVNYWHNSVIDGKSAYNAKFGCNILRGTYNGTRNTKTILSMQVIILRRKYNGHKKTG